MLSRLSLKLFISTLMVNVLISGIIYFSVARSIDQGFLEYIKRGQQQQIEALSDIVIDRWERNGQSWKWLYDRRAWGQVLSSSLETLDEAANEAAIATPFSDPRQFVLFDITGERLAGARVDTVSLMRAPIRSHGRLIAVLGYRAPERVLSTLDRFFLHNQLRNLAIILLALLPASLVLSAGLALWIGRRSRVMALAAQALTLGDYRVRLPTHGQDELSRLSSDINTLARTLEHNREARQRWGADIAHELRTPLAVMRGELEAMQDGVRPMNAQNLHSLSQEVELLNRLVDDLRLLAQSDTHTLDAPFETLNLSEQLATQLEERRYSVETRGLSLNVDIAPNITIEGAPFRLRQLWRNLLDNAIAYTDAPGSIHVHLRRSDANAIITWEDSAPGVPHELLSRLTERLFRLDASRNRRRGGSGLGLSIAKALVVLHGGQMEPDHSSLGGLRWTIVLPLVRRP